MSEIWDEQAERAVLGCVLVANGCFPFVKRLLSPADFHGPAHAMIYDAMCALMAEGRAVDTLTLAERLQARSQLATIGGPAYLMRLDQAVVLTSNVAQYAEIVRDRSVRRRLAGIGRQLTELAGNLALPPGQLQARASQHLLSTDSAVPRWRTLSEHVHGAFAHVLAIEEGKSAPIIPTGVASLDAVVGGWQPTLSVFAARTGVGKSAALATFAQCCAQAGYRVAVFSLEDEGDWLAWRYLAHASGVNQFLLRYRRKTHSEWERVASAHPTFSDWSDRILIDDRPGLTSEELCLAADDAIANHGAQIVFVDHLKEMNHHSKKRERYDLNIEASLQDIRACQKRHRVPFVLFHQLREDDSGKPDATPTLSDMQDAKVIGKMARVVIAATRPPGGDVMTLHILKQTNGLAGCAVQVRFVNGAAMISETEGEQRTEEAAGAKPARVLRGPGYVRAPDEDEGEER